MSVCHFQCFVGPRYKLWGDSTMVWLLGLVIICWLLIWESNNCDLWSTVGFWGKTNFRELRMFINIQEVSHWYVLCWSVSRGSHLYVACWAWFLIGKKCAWLSIRSLDFCGSKVELEPCNLIFTVWRWPWSLDQLSKRALIIWFNFDLSHKCFYTGHISDYPLCFVTRIKMVSMSILSKDQNNQKPTVWWH